MTSSDVPCMVNFFMKHSQHSCLLKAGALPLCSLSSMSHGRIGSCYSQGLVQFCRWTSLPCPGHTSQGTWPSEHASHRFSAHLQNLRPAVCQSCACKPHGQVNGQEWNSKSSLGSQLSSGSLLVLPTGSSGLLSSAAMLSAFEVVGLQCCGYSALWALQDHVFWLIPAHMDCPVWLDRPWYIWLLHRLYSTLKHYQAMQNSMCQTACHCTCPCIAHCIEPLHYVGMTSLCHTNTCLPPI